MKIADSIYFTVMSEVIIDPREAFPDGIPEEYDADTILAALKESGHINAAIAEWGLDQDLHIDIDVVRDRKFTSATWRPW